MNKTKWLLFFIVLIAILFIDYNLSFYGKGFNILRHKITYGYNTDFDNLEGFKIEQEGFIQVIGHGTEITNDIVVEQIISYSYDPNGIYCEILDTNKKTHFIKVEYDTSREMGNKISYKVISKPTLNLKWFNVEK